MRTVHLLFAAALLVILTPCLSLGQVQTNPTNIITSTAVRTPNSGCVTSLQTAANGSKLAIHHETGVSMAGKFLTPKSGPLPKIAKLKETGHSGHK